MEDIRAEEYFLQGNWESAAKAYADYLTSNPGNKYALGRLGTCLLRLHRYDDSLQNFRLLGRPSSARDAINWAALLINRQRLPEALDVLTPLPPRPDAASQNEVFDYVACVLLKEILQFHLIDQNNSKNHPFIPPELYPKNRLLKSLNLAIKPSLWMLEKLGRFWARSGSPGRGAVYDLATNLKNLCWVHGIPSYPGPSTDRHLLEEMPEYEESREIYRQIFLAYLAYWIESGEEVRDLLIASQKPGDGHALYSFIRREKPRNVLEIGTFVGFSTCLIAKALIGNEQSAIYCIDPGISHLSTADPLFHAGQMFCRLKIDRMIQIHKGFFSYPREKISQPIPTLGPNASSWLPPIDIAMIDGDHATTALLQDIMLVLPCLSPRGKLLIHDIRSWRSVRQAVMILFQDEVFNKQMHYREFSPAGIDGFAVVEVMNRS